MGQTDHELSRHELHSHVLVGERGGAPVRNNDPDLGGPKHFQFLVRTKGDGFVRRIVVDVDALVDHIQTHSLGISSSTVLEDPPPNTCGSQLVPGKCPECEVDLLGKIVRDKAAIPRGYRCPECGKKGPFELQTHAPRLMKKNER